MANKYRWSFDGTFISEPTNALEMQDSIAYDEKLKFIYWRKENSFVFEGTAYDYLYSKYTEGFCNEVAVLIEEDCDLNGEFTPVSKGIIKIRDVRYDFIKCKCQSTVNDNNYFSLVNNNASLEHIAGIGKSKNDEVITTALTFNVLIDNPCTLTSTYTRQLFKIHYVIKEFIAFMTDDRVDYDSPFFGVGGEKEYLMTGTGYQLRVDGWHSLFPLLGFKDNYESLFRELDKKYNLGVYIDESGVKPKIIIDKYDNFFGTTKSISINDPPIVKLSTLATNIYNRVKMGGETFAAFDCPDDGDFPTETGFYGFKKEEFNLLSQCNINKELDLEGTYIVDHNIIYQVVVKGVASWDDKIFLFDCKLYLGSIIPELTDIFSDSRYFWNASLTNNNVAPRWEKHLPSSMAAYLEQTNYRFKAVRVGKPPFVFGNPPSPIIFNDDYNLGSDPNNIYGNGTAQGFPVLGQANTRMDAPITGYYLVNYNIPVLFNNTFAIMDFNVYTAAGALKYTTTKTYLNSAFNSVFNINLSTTLYMLATDYVIFDNGFSTFPAPPYNGISIELLSSPVISGVAFNVVQEKALLLRIDVECFLTRTQYATMKTNFIKYVEIFSKGSILRGYVFGGGGVKYNENINDENGNTLLTLISSNSFIDGRN